MGFVDDSESTAMPSLWETVLKLVVTVEKASSYVNLPVHLTQRYVSLISGGCYGNASKMGRVTLALMRFLRDYAPVKCDFDRKVVAGFCQGFSVRSVRASSLEALTLSTCLFQSLQFMAKEEEANRSQEESQASSRVVSLFQTQVIHDFLLFLTYSLTNFK